MSFKSKVSFYNNEKLSLDEISKLKEKLNNNVDNSKKELIEYVTCEDVVEGELEYLINELLEDKECYDAFISSNS